MRAIGHRGSGCFPQPVALDVNFILGPSVESLIGRALVVEAEVPVQSLPGLGRAGVGMQVNLLILDRAPQPLDEPEQAPA